jgi:alpha-aminoadipate carrier protein LysW
LTKEVGAMLECPVCGAKMGDLPPGTRPGEVVTCPECAIQLEVTSVEPPELDLLPEVEEDWGE